MPTPSPALKRLPRWRTMISPPVTAWPAKTFTPRRWALESRPLRLEPRPFLCAIGTPLRAHRGDACARARPRADLRDLDAGQVLAVAGAPLVAALGLELEHAQLRPAHVADDRRRDLHLRQRGGVEDRLVVAHEQRLERDARALGFGQALDQERLPLLDAVLLAAGFDDRVHGGVGSAWEAFLRRLSRTAPSASSAAAPGGRFYAILDRDRSQQRLVDRHGLGSRAPDGLDAHHQLLPHEPPAAAHRDDVAVDLRDRVVGRVHVRLDDLDQHLLADAERDCALLDLGGASLEGHREVVEREALGALEVKAPSGALFELVQHACAVAGELRADARVHLDQERLDTRRGGGELGEPALELDR